MKIITLSQNKADFFINIDQISVFYVHKSPGGGTCHNTCILVDSTAFYVVDTVEEITNKINEANK